MSECERQIPSVLLVHGIRSSGTMWRGQVEHLRSLGAHATAVDLPGHGSLVHTPFDLPTCIEVIDEAWAGLPPGPKIAVGLSLGSYLTLHWAARASDPPDAVLAASGSIRPQGIGLAGYRAIAALIGKLPDGGRRLNDAMVRLALSEQAATDAGAGGFALDVMSQALGAIGATKPLVDLPRITAPVWLVNGAWDHFRLEQKLFWAAVNTGRLIVIPKAGHLVSLDAPKVFNDVLSVLLDEVAEATREGRPAGPR